MSWQSLLRHYYALRLALLERALERDEAPSYDDLGHVMAKLAKLSRVSRVMITHRAVSAHGRGPHQKDTQA